MDEEQISAAAGLLLGEACSVSVLPYGKAQRLVKLWYGNGPPYQLDRETVGILIPASMLACHDAIAAMLVAGMSNGAA